MNKIAKGDILEAILGHIRILEDRIAVENTEVIIGMIAIVEIEVEVNLERGHSARNNSYNRRNDRSASNSRSRSGSRASTNRDRIRCYKGREYDHFTKDCPTSKEEREIETNSNKCLT